MLWIDDEVTPADPAVRLLTLDDFHVDCAGSGAAGLVKARNGGYDAIILDLRLPDMNGLAVLATLRAEGNSTPVLVLTGWGDRDSSLVAGRLGVVSLFDKPLAFDDLLAAVRAAAVARTAGDDHIRWIERPPDAARSNPECARLNRLSGELAEFARLNGASGAGDDRMARAAPAGEIRTPVESLLHALADPDLGVPGFLGCAEALRQLLTAEMDSSAAGAVRAQEAVARAARRRSTWFHPKVRAAIARIEASLVTHDRAREDACARELAIDPAHLGRLLRRDTGLGFREWRTAVAIQAAVRRLVETGELIKKISYDIGFVDPSELDRKFHELFGISPVRFRQLCRDAARR